MNISLLKRMIRSDEGLLGRALVTFVIRASSAVAQFIMTIVVARFLGLEQSGIFFLSITILLAISIVSRFGLDNALIRKISPCWENKDYSTILGYCVYSIYIVLIVGSILSVALNGFSYQLAILVFEKPVLADVLQIMSFAVIPLSLVWLFSGIMKAIRMPAIANFIEAGMIPFVLILLVLFYHEAHVAPLATSVAKMYLGACILAMSVAAILFYRKLPGQIRPRKTSFKELIDSSYPLLWVDVLNYCILWSSSLFVGYYLNAESVGLYNVAHRTAVLVSFILIVFNSITAPRFATLYASGHVIELERLAVKSAGIMSIAAIPVLLFVMIYPSLILSLFGSEFADAKTLLIVISLGQFFNVMTGSVGYLLIMTGNERLMRNNVIFTALLSIVLNVLLIDRFGLIGAAVSTSICLVVQNLVAAWLVYLKLGVRTIPGWALLKKMA